MEKPANAINPDMLSKYLLLTVLGGLILYWCKSILIPLSFSVLIAFLMYPSCRWLENRGMPRGMSIALLLLLLLLFISGLMLLLGSQFMRFASEWPALKVKLFEALTAFQIFLQEKTGVSPEEQLKWIGDSLQDNKGDTLTLIRDFAYGTAVNSVLLILIPILSGLILMGRERWVHVIHQLLPSVRPERISELLRETITAYFNFIKGMGIVYLIVGILNSIGLAVLGIPHPVLFGFIASILTFIPFVGIIVASLLPIAVSWLTYDSVWYPIGVIAIFTVVQYLEANVIFPLAVSNRLSINPFVTIFVILLGGLLWGASGMILFIPFVAMVKLVADRSHRLKALSVLLGTGK